MPMWFDPYAKLAGDSETPLATSATTATEPCRNLQMSRMSQLSQAPCDVEAIIYELEERAAIREYDGGQERSEAEAKALADVAQVTGISPETLQRIWASKKPPSLKNNQTIKGD